MGARLEDALSSALFGKTRRNVLALLFAEPERPLFLREIVRRTGSGQGAVQRELRRLTAAGILDREGAGRTITYHPNPGSPIYEELRGILAKTAGVVEHLRHALAPIRDRIDVAFIYGSFGRDTRIRPASDIDVMVVGQAGFGEIVDHSASVQEKHRREINPTVYTREEFARRAHEDDHFVRSVLTHPKLFISGGLSDLQRLAEVGRGGDAPAHSRRNPRTAGHRRSRPAG